MDQNQAPEALTPSTSSKLNAGAPEFVPRAAAPSPRPPPMLYARPPTFVRSPPPPPYYGYENYYPQNMPPPFYGYNVEAAAAAETVADANKGGDGAATAAAASVKNGVSDAQQKIVNQVEFYFSDINLATTDQLFRYMSKDPEGYVPLSVVASFKKIKAAVSDSTQLASILRSSNKLLVSEDGKKIKRRQPLTESDMEELQSCIVIAENLPEDHSHQNLMKIFSSIGSVKSIRTCPPQNSNTAASSTSRSGKGEVLPFSSKFHAFVEYESVEVAEKAVAELKDETNWRNGLKVRLLLKNAVKSQSRGKKIGQEGQPTGKKDDAGMAEMNHPKENNLEDSLPQSDAQNQVLQTEDNAKGNAQRKGRNNVSSKGKGKGHGHGRGRPQHPTTNGVSILGSAPPSESKASGVPRMPDGTKGFSMGRGKPV